MHEWDHRNRPPSICTICTAARKFHRGIALWPIRMRRLAIWCQQLILFIAPNWPYCFLSRANVAAMPYQPLTSGLEFFFLCSMNCTWLISAQFFLICLPPSDCLFLSLIPTLVSPKVIEQLTNWATFIVYIIPSNFLLRRNGFQNDNHILRTVFLAKKRISVLHLIKGNYLKLIHIQSNWIQWVSFNGILIVAGVGRLLNFSNYIIIYWRD